VTLAVGSRNSSHTLSRSTGGYSLEVDLELDVLAPR
jgi:hypothetical protein